jgi:colanic acid biosynthesis protein WcaH
MQGNPLKMKMEKLIRELEALIPNPCRGLPEDVFLFISRTTPLINVDLLIQDEEKRTLLTWRDDGYSAPGWHVPGGILRFKEVAEERICAVARQELLAEVEFDPAPLAIHEIIHPTRRERGHFISLLYRCRLRTALDPSRRFQEENPRRDAWMWHSHFPDHMIPVHEIYRPFFKTPA